jgi:hypothetical protein
VAVRNFVGVRFLWCRPDCLGDVLQVDSHARPGRRSAAHCVDEHVRRPEMRRGLGVTRFPPFESGECIGFSQRPRNLDQRMDWDSPSPSRRSASR